MPVPASNVDPTDRPLVLVFAIMLTLALWTTTRAWQAPILDRHEFRQLQTAVSAHWMKEAGFRLDYETPLFGPPWSIPIEFPVYQWCVATASNVLGTGLEPTARGVALFFFLAMLPAIYGLSGMLGLAPTRRLLVLSAVLASPTYLFYARTFMIETTALCGAVWFLYAITRALRDDSGPLAILATVLGILAGLAKVTTFAVFLPPAAVLIWPAWRQRWVGRAGNPAGLTRATLFAAVPVVAGVATAYWWVRHGDGLKDANPFAGFLRSSELIRWNWGTWDQRMSVEFWTENWRNLSGLVFGAAPLAVLLLCAALVAPLHRRVAFGGAAFFLGALLLFANLYFRHDYYYCANAVFLLAGAGFILAGVWDSPRVPPRGKWLAIVLVLGGQLTTFSGGYGLYLRKDKTAAPGISAVIRAVTAPSDIVVIYGWDWNAMLPYYTERRAILVPQGRELETKVLDDILRQLPAKQAMALVIRNTADLTLSPEFIRERLNRFNLSPAPFATSSAGDLYLSDEQIAASSTKLQGRQFAGVTLNTDPLPDPDADRLKEIDLAKLDLPMLSPRPAGVRGMFEMNVGEANGRPVFLAHPTSELRFLPPADATRIDAEFGIADAAYAAGNSLTTDGITIEIVEIRENGLRRLLFRRDLDPVNVTEDRGRQAIHLADIGPFTGPVIFRFTPGPKGNLVNDWAYWGRIEIR